MLESLKKKTKTYRRVFRRSQVTIIAFLAGVIVFLLVLPWARMWLPAYLTTLDDAEGLVKVTAYSSMVRDLFYIMAMVIAGAWSYYLLVYTRTLKPCCLLDIELIDVVRNHRDVVVLRLKVTNTGRVRIRPVAARIIFSVGHYASECIVFEETDRINNVLLDHYGPEEMVHLEPKDEVSLDIATYLVSPLNESRDRVLMCSLLHVEGLLVDSDDHAWKIYRILNLSSARRT